MITEVEQQTSDIDWFFTNGEDIVFVASGGGKLPQSVANLGKEIELVSQFFRSIRGSTDVETNPSLNRILKSPVNEQYLTDFRTMSSKGLFSFDKTELGDFENGNYHLVMKPVTRLKVNQLPKQIFDIISKTNFNGLISANINIDEIL